MKKKFLALVMTLSMVLSLVPMTALAAGDGQKQETPVATEGQPAGAGANEGKQESGSNTGANNASGGDGTDTSDTNTNNGSNENAGGTESGDSSTSGTGSTEGGSIPSSGGTTSEGGESTTTPKPSNNAAKIDGTEYNTLDEAIAAAKENDVIELLNDCELTVGTINKTITINGNGKKLTVPKQEKIESGALAINAPATFNNTQLSFANESNWSVTMSDDGVFTLGENSVCNIEHHGIYATKNAVINVQKASKLIIQNTDYTAMMAEHGPDGKKISDPVTAQLNITGGSTVEINHTTSNNGINWFKIHVTNSFLYIKECANQGLVKCELVLDSSEAEISENAIGITGYTNDEVATLNNNSTLKMENNKEAGLFMWGGLVNVHEGNSLTISGTGSSVAEPQDASYYAALGLNSMKGSVTIEDGAEVNIIDNDVSGIYNKGTMTLGDSTVITENGKKNQRASHGGGIDNHGTITVSAKAQVYNNHAATAGDDIYNTGKITFGDVGEGWVLDDCDHDINGWYDDGSGYSDGTYSRWAAHTYPSYISQFSEFDEETGLATLDYEVALKAAHDVIQEDPIQPDNDRAHSKSKEATTLVKQSDGTYTSDVTLTLPSVEESPVYDVVFVLDKSASAELEREALAMLKQLQNQIAGTQTTIKVGVVIFNKEAHVTELKNLTTEYAQIEEAIKEKIESGTNTHAGLLAGKELLDNDKNVTADHKYLIFVSDGITYMYNVEPTAIALQGGDQTETDGSDAFAGPDNWSTKYGSNDVPDNWKTWLEGISTLIQKDKDTYELPYAQTASGLQKTKWLPYIEKMNHATSVDKALYLTNETYQSVKTAGYHCYAMMATQNEGQECLWGPSFMSYLAGGKEVSFEDIHNDIYYLLSEGSTVEDVIGYGTDNRGNAYNFDFVNDMSKLTLKVGTETLEATDLSLDVSYDDANETARYGFAPKRVQITTDMDQSNIPEQYPYSYDYVLHYYQNGKDGKSDECFVWDINVPVSKFAPVSLTYQVKLTNAQTSSGTYGTYDKNGSQNKDSLYTNKSATLYPVDSNQDYGTPENFLKPTVSYTVSGGGGGGGGGGTVTIPDDVPTGLDLKNHYGYIIGYPVDYYTGKPTTDQTKKPVRPEGKITRAEVATIYFRMLTDENRAANWNQVSGFSDVKSSAWYNNAISTLTKAGILKGYEDGTFQPNGYITRAEFATIAIRFFSGVYEGEDLFPDIKGHWAEDYINNAANKGLVKGYEDGTFGPDRYITRAEAVTLVNRTLNRHPHNDGLHKDMLVWPDNMDTSKWYYADMQEATNSHEPDKNKSTADKEYWGKMLPIRDWEALEKEWSNANSAPGEGEVV